MGRIRKHKEIKELLDPFSHTQFQSTMLSSHSAALHLNFVSTREMPTPNHRLVRKSSTGWRSAPRIQARLTLARQSYSPGSFRADFRNLRAFAWILFWNLVRTFASAFPNLGQGWVQIHNDNTDLPIFWVGTVCSRPQRTKIGSSVL